MRYRINTETRRLSHDRSPRIIDLLPITFIFIILLLYPLPVPSQPVIEVDPFTFDLETGEEFVAEFQFMISNRGDEELIWQSHEFIVNNPDRLPYRDEPGEILGSFVWRRAGSDQIKTGIAFDPGSELIILTSFSTDYCGILDPSDNYRVVNEWNAGESLLGAACLNGIIYIVNSGHESFGMWDIEGNNLGRLDTDGYAPVTVTASAEANLLIFMDFDGADCLNVMTPDGEIIGTIGQGELFDENPIGTIVWVDNHRPGHLWFVSQHNHRVFQLDVRAHDGDQFNPRIVQSFDMPGVVDPHELDGIGHDGHNLIFGIRGREDYLIVDDGIVEQFWLDWLPKSGNLEPGEDLRVFGYVDMHGLNEGYYEAELHLLSNDPESPDVIINIAVIVEGFPNAVFSWHESAGFPDIIDFNGFNDEIWNGYESFVPLSIGNTGTMDIEIIDIFFSHRAFSFDGDLFVLAPGESREIALVFRPSQPVLFESSLFIRSTDYDNPVVEIPVRGQAYDPPIIQIERQEILLQPEGNSPRCSIEIANAGASRLVWRGELTGNPPRNPHDSLSTESFLSPDSGSIEPGDFSQLFLSFLRNDPEIMEEEFLLSIISNDPAERIVTVEIIIDWSLGVVEKSIPIASSIILTPPHPQPANSTAAIDYYLPQSAIIETKLYTLNGRQVRRSSGQWQSIGWHRMVVDAEDLLSGVYFIQLSAGNNVAKGKLVIVK